MFRYKINQLGFFQYQKSVFIIPYECKDEVFLLRLTCIWNDM